MLSKKPDTAELRAESEMHAGLIRQARAQLACVSANWMSNARWS
jgi:hypothetical protein